jgi:hypothetical protein
MDILFGCNAGNDWRVWRLAPFGLVLSLLVVLAFRAKISREAISYQLGDVDRDFIVARPGHTTADDQLPLHAGVMLRSRIACVPQDYDDWSKFSERLVRENISQ